LANKGGKRESNKWNYTNESVLDTKPSTVKFDIGLKTSKAISELFDVKPYISSDDEVSSESDN